MSNVPLKISTVFGSYMLWEQWSILITLLNYSRQRYLHMPIIRQAAEAYGVIVDHPLTAIDYQDDRTRL